MGKGFLDRIHDAWERGEDIAGGVAGVVDGTADLVIDLAQAPFTDDEYGGFWDTLSKTFAKSGGQILDSAVGPDKGVGALVGGLPEVSLRRPVHWAMDRAEDAYGFASEKIAKGVAYQATQRRSGPLVGVPGTPDIKASNALAEGHSPGQVVAASFLAGDVRDPAKVEAAIRSGWGQVVSASSDALLRYYLDPTVIAGKGVAAARNTYRSAEGLRAISIRSIEDINAAMDSTRVNRFIERIDEIKGTHADQAAAKIRDELFPGHALGSQIATILAEPADLASQRLTIRALLGDADALAELDAAAPLPAHMLRNLVSDADDALAREAGEALLDVDPEVLYPELDRIARWDDAFGSVGEVPRATRSSQARSAIARSDFYQKNPLTRPVRTVTNMRPHHWLDLNDARSDVQIARLLRKSDMPEEAQLALRAEYMRATTASARQQVALKVENEITAHVLERHGVTREVVDHIVQESNRLRDGAMGALRRRVYDTAGRGIVEHIDLDGTVERIALPLHVTQQADLLPLVDIDSLDSAARAASRHGWTRFRLNHPVTDLPAEALESFYRLWKPATLLRVGWPVRVLADEQLRMVAELGRMTGYGKTGLAELGDRAASAAARKIPGLRGVDAVSREAVDLRAMARYAGREVDGVAIAGPFEDAGGDVARQRISSAGAFNAIADVDDDTLLRTLREHTGSWRSFTPYESEHLNVWADVLNRQIKQSAFARFFLEGGSVDDGVRWLRETPEGIKYAREMSWKPEKFAKHADDVFDQVSRYAPGDVARELLEKDLDAGGLNRLVTKIDDRPAVHGEELAQALGTSALSRLVKNVIASTWEGLGKVPTDVLSRQPFFAAVYEDETARLAGLLKSQDELTPERVKQITASARRKAINLTQQVLYDLAEESEFAHMLRFASPFYMAFQEVSTRWPMLASHNPAFAARARLVWNAPEKAGVVVDENGYRIDENGIPHDPMTDEALSKDARGKERYVQLPWKIPGLPTKGPVRFNKKGFNLALTGSPGVSPVVQVPVNEIVKQRPELADSVDFILPFGSTQETLSLLLPATAKRAFALAQGDENRVFTNDLGRIYTTKMTDYLLGKRDTKPTYEEVMRDTKRFYSLRTAISWLSPFAPTFDSPYQPYINAYRNAQARLRDDKYALGRNEDGTATSVDEWFLDTYGEEFFYLTTTFTRAKDGVPPTIEGWQARGKYKDLIEKYPDLGGLVIGAEGAGEFARGVYDAQLAKPIRPGSATKQRESLDFETFERDPEIRLGWLKYRKYMDLLDAELTRRGLPNMQVGPARDLAEMKRQIIEQLGEKYPDWFEEFNVVDRGAFTRRLEGMREIVADERLSQRPDIEGLHMYLKYRDLVVNELNNREAKTLTSVANQDLAFAWASIRAQIVERNPAFADLYYRYLESDPMEAE